ncbi:hypothetical protein SUGI_0847960 [Cryptomeria japonica]|uniref:protein SMALL AUXIN UP-REGULATED RNA 51 n=1 Tax=Cryptomeria japonica TaxID=3369 RepID=UPI002414C124|nr:protein SMALL AUXIN UP-REGULATED RNA 51 [Cryptomeria japonica]GLJ40968.1 hypothetical protein SUGI_0847960 [Cryptomeria japonica]
MPQPVARFQRHHLCRTSPAFSDAYNQLLLYTLLHYKAPSSNLRSSENIYTELCRSVMERSQSLEKIKQITKKLQRLGSLKKTLSFKLLRRSIDQEEEEENQIERRRSGNFVPRGHLAVYAVREDLRRRRFVFPVDYLKQPVFKDLLRMAEEEFGFEYDTGPLTIPCDPQQFEEIINKLKDSDGFAANFSLMTSSYASNSKPYFSNGKTVMVH